MNVLLATVFKKATKCQWIIDDLPTERAVIVSIVQWSNWHISLDFSEPRFHETEICII